MKKMISTPVLMLLLTLTASAQEEGEVYERFPAVMRIVQEDVPIFYESSDGSTSIGALHIGEKVLILGRDEKSEMIQIETVDGSVGWISFSFITASCFNRLPTDDSRKMVMELSGEEGPVAGAAIEFADGLVEFVTDEEGRVRVEGIPEGAWDIRCVMPDGTEVLFKAAVLSDPETEYVELNSETGHRLVVQVSPLRQPGEHSSVFSVGKPNVYLYPEAETDVNVWLAFVAGGRMTASEPEYIEGWDVTATPEGKITAYEPVWFLDPEAGEPWPIPTRGEPAGEYDFLFYEGEVASPGQLDRGWVVAQGDAERFFREKLAAYGFNERERGDFLEYWVPRLVYYPLYAVYPQVDEDYDGLVSMSVFPEPDSVLRVVFTVRGLWEGAELALPEPTVAPFERGGFTVVEWGVILKEDDARLCLH
jgi:hypothetical protein